MSQTQYCLESWFRPTPLDGVSFSYESLLTEVLGEGSVLVFHQDDDYQGDWTALVTDGERIGVVEGYFGSCSGCDSLEAAYGNPSEMLELAEEYLRSVRTFPSWDALRSYLEESEAEDRWSFRNSRSVLAPFVAVGMPLGARDILARLRLDDPSLDPVRAAEIALTLHRG